MKTYQGLIVMLVVLAIFSSCNKCEECTLTSTATVNGAGEQTTIRQAEYCDGDLKAIKENTSYEKDGIKYQWVCE
ncbi:MAG: hypothetical protein KDC92_10275 [Bacteroidetes bacterium]|nr:hypothetical protein [Bacteroidota bacterium]